MSSSAYADQFTKIIVTFPPGGSADIFIRALEPVVTADLKSGFVIENRAGAGGFAPQQARERPVPFGGVHLAVVSFRWQESAEGFSQSSASFSGRSVLM